MKSTANYKNAYHEQNHVNEEIGCQLFAAIDFKERHVEGIGNEGLAY